MNRATNVLAAPLLCLSLFGSALASTPQTTPKAASPENHQAKSTDDGDVINGIALMPGVERLSYISPRYYGIRPSYDACIKATQEQVALKGDCADTEFTYQDARLNKAYKALVSAITVSEGKDAIKEIQAAQRAWLAFYEKDCAVRADRFGSTPGPSTLSTCRMESTAIRAQELEDWRNSYVATHQP
ncbi:lysozyme inhibitor LprI family protein [Dyella subtropica]|uniref:lysozyme inhibitor LprI family protein n=1 Tax=Dyella subtropica TaxID=2992127 RepID=UPI00224FD980|nr:lysozyme inhibitor LprI family protein [Dyella subtropica]